MNRILKLSPLLLAVVLFGCGEGAPGTGTGTTTGGTTTTTGGSTGSPPLNEDGLPPSGSFGVSDTQTGPFLSDVNGTITSPSDENVVNVAAGDTFYAQVAYSDPGGISSVTVNIVNSSPAGLRAPLSNGQSVGGFTLGDELTGCVLDGTQTTVTCVYPIAVGSGTQNIDDLDGADGEFAYVFRTDVTDAAGNAPDRSQRGYVVIGGSSGGTTSGTTSGGSTTGSTTSGTTTTGGTTSTPTTGTTTGGTTTTPTTTGSTTGIPTTTGVTTGTTTTGGTNDGGTDNGGTDDGTTTGGSTTGGSTTGTTGVPTPTTGGGSSTGL